MEIEGGGSSENPGGPSPKELFGGGVGGTEVPEIPPGLPQAAGGTSGTDQGMKDLIEAMNKMNTNMTNQFQTLQQQLSDQTSEFQNELAKLREEMVTRPMLEKFEVRIKTLETQGLANPEVS